MTTRGARPPVPAWFHGSRDQFRAVAGAMAERPELALWFVLGDDAPEPAPETVHEIVDVLIDGVAAAGIDEHGEPTSEARAIDDLVDTVSHVVSD